LKPTVRSDIVSNPMLTKNGKSVFFGQ